MTRVHLHVELPKKTNKSAAAISNVSDQPCMRGRGKANCAIVHQTWCHGRQGVPSQVGLIPLQVWQQNTKNLADLAITKNWLYHSSEYRQYQYQGCDSVQEIRPQVPDF